MALNDAKIAELKATHAYAELTLVMIGDEDVVVKKPTRVQWTRFREGIVKGNNVAAGADLLRDVVVYPSWSEFTAFLEREPGREDEMVGKVREIASSGEKVSTKKL